MRAPASVLALLLAATALPASICRAQTGIGTAFTYQGRLQMAGAPASGTFDLRFTLFDDSTAGTQVGPTQCFDNIAVSAGLFSLPLDFGQVFAGPRWLQIEARADSIVGNCGTGAFTPLSPRQAITPTPAAIDLALPLTEGASSLGAAFTIGNSTGDAISGISNAVGRSGVYGVSTDAGGFGIFGRNNASGNVGYFAGGSYAVAAYTTDAASIAAYFENSAGGIALSTSGPARVSSSSPTTDALFVVSATGSGPNGAIHGVATGANGNGVVGEANTGVDAWGVYGLSASGIGVAGIANSFTSFGVYGSAPAPSGSVNSLTAAGVVGDSNSGEGVVGITAGSGRSGVYGVATSTAGYGVVGRNSASQCDGTLGSATAGIFAHTSDSSKYAAYFDGRAYVSDKLGIGTDQPSVPLQITGGTDASLTAGGNIVVGQLSGANVVMDNNEIMARNNSSAANLYINALGGNVGIGTNNPMGFLLAVNGSAAKPGGGSWSTLSDARLKKNIRPLTGSLDKLLALHGVSFEYIDPKSINELPGKRIGLVAQDVEPVIPDWIDTGPDGYKRLTCRGFEALAIEALRDLRDQKDNDVKSLRHEVQSLRAEAAAKDSQIADLQRRLALIEHALEAGASDHTPSQAAPAHEVVR